MVTRTCTRIGHSHLLALNLYTVDSIYVRSIYFRSHLMLHVQAAVPSQTSNL